MDSIFQRTFTISSYDLNPRRQARLTAMANFLQEMAYSHANRMGYGYDQMKEQETMWVLSRMKIRMDRYPGWDDRILIETWPSGTEKLFALRNYRIRDQSGKLIGRATTYWLILNIDTRRPVRPNAEMKFNRFIHDEKVFDNPLVKIELPEEDQFLDRRHVQYSDLDIIRHVNNVKYMEWCIDLAMRDQKAAWDIGELEINYMQEARLGETIQIRGIVDQTGESFFVAGRKEDGKEIFRARISVRERGEDQAGNPS